MDAGALHRNPIPPPEREIAPAPASDVWLQAITVSYDYPVYFTADVFAPANPDLAAAIARKEPARRHRMLLVVEGNVAEAWPALLRDAERYADFHRDRLELVAVHILPGGGEALKNDPAVPGRVREWVNRYGIDRQSCVVCVGGGALQDAVGYAAATAHRGVRLVRIPTTTLSQNDSAVGVKNSVNAFGKKNFLGTFAPPFAVLNDVRLLDTLGERDRRAGLSEAVKVALIRDAAFFRWLAENAYDLCASRPEATARMVRRSAEIHLEHIATSGDPFEFGSARPLDFGHWAAHKLESLTRSRLRHGEAVAIGVALDTVYSVLAGFLDPADGDAVLTLLERLGFRLWDDALGRPELLEGLREFREHLGGDLTVTLLRGIGRGFESHHIDEGGMRASVERLRGRYGPR
jgi:3-dehydroquinate synthase